MLTIWNSAINPRIAEICLVAILFSGGAAVSQTPTTPNLTNPTTSDDYKALKALEEAKAEALQSQTKLLEAQKALKKAQSEDPLAQQKASQDAKTEALQSETKLLEAQKALQKAQAEDPLAQQIAATTQAANLAAQQKALAESQASILKTKFTVPDSPYTGEVKAGDKAGNFEGALLAARAVKLAAGQIARTVKEKTSGVGSVVLYGAADLPDFQALLAYRAQYKTISKVLEGAIAKSDDAIERAAPLLPPKAELVSPAAIGAGLEAVNKILGFFRTDYSVQGIIVANDDLMLIDCLAGELKNNQKKVFVLAQYNAAALQDSSIISDLEKLAANRAILQQRVEVAMKTSDDLTTGANKENDPMKKKAMTDAAANLKAAADQAKTAVTMYDALLTKLTGADDKGKVPLAAIIQQETVRKYLQDEGAALMTAKISSEGGSYYTRKNLWSLFGGMPFFVMGGAVVNYGVFDGKDGSVLVAGSLAIDGGYFNVKDLEKQFPVQEASGSEPGDVTENRR